MAGPESVPNAAEFLARALPWPVEGGPKFFVNIHYRTPKIINGAPILGKDGRQEQSYPGRACLNVREAAGVTAWANTFENGVGTDIYVCMSGQSMAKEKVNSRGRTYYNAIRNFCDFPNLRLLGNPKANYHRFFGKAFNDPELFR